LFINIFFFAYTKAYSTEGKIKAGGWAKNTFSLIDYSSINKDTNSDNKTAKKNNSCIRFTIFDQINNELSFDFAYEISSFYGSHAQKGIFANTRAVNYRAYDLHREIHSSTHEHYNLLFYQQIDRTCLTFSSDRFDLYAGRQTITFGSSRFINPMDVLSPFSFDTIDKEERTGVDAIRVRIPFGFMGEIDGGVVLGDHLKSQLSALYLNTKFSIKETDYAFMTMIFRENLLIGADFQTSIMDAGSWMEAAYTFSGATSDLNSDDNYLRVSTGVDYNLFANLYVFLEYHYNDAGGSSPKNYLKLFDKTAYSEGQVFLLSRHYLISGLLGTLTPLCTLQTNIIINLSDGSFFISPRLEYSLIENFYLDIGAFINIGVKTRSSDSQSGISELGSEFGNYPNIYFTSLRYYF